MKILCGLAIILFLIVGTIIVKRFSEVEGIGDIKQVNFDLHNNLIITDIGSYSGIYMEDASDDEVSDVMMIKVKNNGDKALQYAEIILSGKDSKAVFKLSTLNPGQTVMVLEANRRNYDKKVSYTEASSQYVVFFEDVLSIYENSLEIQPLDGGFNIKNISTEDITGEIIVYFKDYENDLLCGGITYRGRIEEGLKAGEIKQIMTDNFSESNTRVMFITITETEK